MIKGNVPPGLFCWPLFSTKSCAFAQPPTIFEIFVLAEAERCSKVCVCSLTVCRNSTTKVSSCGDLRRVLAQYQKSIIIVIHTKIACLQITCAPFINMSLRYHNLSFKINFEVFIEIQLSALGLLHIKHCFIVLNLNQTSNILLSHK